MGVLGEVALAIGPEVDHEEASAPQGVGPVVGWVPLEEGAPLEEEDQEDDLLVDWEGSFQEEDPSEEVVRHEGDGEGLDVASSVVVPEVVGGAVLEVGPEEAFPLEKVADPVGAPVVLA